jgi:hypothetical protein
VALLRRAAARALALSAPDSAITYLRRGLAEPPSHEERPVVMLELGRAEARAGRAEAGADLRRAIELAPDAAARSLAALELARAIKYGGGSAAALPVLENCLAETAEPVAAELLEVEILGMAHVSAETRVHLAGRPRDRRSRRSPSTALAAAARPTRPLGSPRVSPPRSTPATPPRTSRC